MRRRAFRFQTRVRQYLQCPRHRWGSNLTDERFAAAKQNVTGIKGIIEGIVYMAPPRLIGLRVTYDF